eukprot:scaffold47589_cov60-Phaeocystis_antarctica.AAC.1
MPMVGGRDERKRKVPPPNLQAIQFNSLLMDPTYRVMYRHGLCRVCVLPGVGRQTWPCIQEDPAVSIQSSLSCRPLFFLPTLPFALKPAPRTARSVPLPPPPSYELCNSQ